MIIVDQKEKKRRRKKKEGERRKKKKEVRRRKKEERRKEKEERRNARVSNVKNIKHFNTLAQLCAHPNEMRYVNSRWALPLGVLRVWCNAFHWIGHLASVNVKG